MSSRYMEASDLDLDPPARGATIGEILADADLSTLSDGEFDVAYLAKYPHVSELDDSCCRAVEDYSSPALSRPGFLRESDGSCDGTAAEIYGLDAPRGWVPTLKKLRARAENVAAHREAAENAALHTTNEEPPVRPKKIFTDSLSAIPNLNGGAALCAYLEDREELKSRFVELAREVGVTRYWQEALHFLQYFTDQLDDGLVGDVPDPLLECLREAQQRVSEYTPQKRLPVELRIESLRAKDAACRGVSTANA